MRGRGVGPRGRGRRFVAAWSLLGVLALLTLVACGGSDEPGAGAGAGNTTEQGRTLRISAIPDQDVSVLNRQYTAVAEYLSDATGLSVEYVPMVDYAALVTAFERGDIHLAWFGGLTGVQARAVTEGAEAFAQRPRDAEFHSKFIVQADLPVETLQDLKGLTFTFGSESSTSGHLMPRYFLTQEGIDPDSDFQGPPNYSGSHDRTIELVQAGAFQAGVLNESVWQQRVADGAVDLDKVREFHTTPAYFDYHWTIRGDLDEVFGAGTADKVRDAILSMGPEQQEILDLFDTDSFVPTTNENYRSIEEVARELGLIS